MNEDMERVLDHLAEVFADPTVRRVNTPFDVPGLSFHQRVAPALDQLESASPPYIAAVDRVAELGYPPVVTGLTARGWKAVGGHRETPDR